MISVETCSKATTRAIAWLECLYKQASTSTRTATLRYLLGSPGKDNTSSKPKTSTWPRRLAVAECFDMFPFNACMPACVKNHGKKWEQKHKPKRVAKKRAPNQTRIQNKMTIERSFLKSLLRIILKIIAKPDG